MKIPLRPFNSLNVRSLKPKAWVSLFVLSIVCFTALCFWTIKITLTVKEEVASIQEIKQEYVKQFIHSEVTGELAAVKNALYSLKSIVDEYQPTPKLTNVVGSILKSIPNIKNLVIFDEDGNSLYKPRELQHINVSDRDYFQFHKNNPNLGFYISNPFIGRMLQLNIFTVSLAVTDENGRFKGVYLASISSDLFANLEQSTSLANLHLVVSSSRNSDIYYDGNNDEGQLYKTFELKNTPLTFSLYLAEDNHSILSYIKRLMFKMHNLLLIWGGFSIILLAIFFFLLIRQYQTSQRHLKSSLYDTLTNIYNRRAFMSLLNNEITRSLRYQNNLSVIMVDIDYFKSINDQYGHGCGDQVLIQFAQIFKKLSRETDTFARIGGEEFALFLPETDLKGAIVTAQKYRNAIENHAFNTDEFVGQCTASFGVSTLSELPETLKDKHSEALLKIADIALYDAKKTRNTVKPD